ncbi:MAG TPA: hypothetical protein VFV81_06335, partial [Verrucomicrobiae bacterium]|nr:hypothetical protein [Verrucomicrobiae bacterium]
TVTIYDKTGKEVLVTNTPANVKLRRRHGFLTFEDYRVVVQAEGYYPFETHVKSSINPWYVGNIIFGGLVGLVIVDPATGAIFTISPRKIDENLVSSAVPLTPEELKQAQLKLNPPLTNSPPISLAPRIHRQ